jgi:hypothetical protein
VRGYDVGAAALAIDAPRKWVDNLLTTFDLPGVASVRQGVSRRISYPALIRLALIRELVGELRMGAGDAVDFAAKLLDSGHETVLDVGQIRLIVDLPAISRRLDERLSATLESAPRPRRGRPPRPENGLPRARRARR